MRAFSHWIVVLCASPAGVVVLAALDSTLFFSLPFGIDASVVILAARLHDLWWIVPLIAAAGSLAGAALTFWMGIKIGEQGLERWIPAKRLSQIRRRVHAHGAIAFAVLDLIPPPFPFTPFVLAAGALDLMPRTFFVTLAVCRVLRFGLEALLARIYGSRILSWLESELFHSVVMFFIALAIGLTALSLVQVARAARSGRRSIMAGS